MELSSRKGEKQTGTYEKDSAHSLRAAITSSRVRISVSGTEIISGAETIAQPSGQSLRCEFGMFDPSDVVPLLPCP
jgi:hypothetical protein